MFSSITGQLAQAGLCSVVLLEGLPRLVCVQEYCRMAGLGWLVFNILQDGGLCWLVYGSFMEGWPTLVCVQ